MTIRHTRWVLAGLLFLSTTINYIDRQAIGIVSVDIRREFRLNEQDYSHVLFFFFVAYALMYAGSGYLLDRLGTRRGFAAFITGWSIAQMLHGFAIGKWSLAAFRFFLGFTTGAGIGRLALASIELASAGAPQAEIGFFATLHEQDPVFAIKAVKQR